MNKQNDKELEAIKLMAQASSSPFKTAFKASMGIAAAQLVVGLGFLGVVGIVILILALLIK